MQGYHFRRQQPIDGYIVDFYCHAFGIVVEVDGGSHRSKMEYDSERDLILEARGLRILRFSNEDIHLNLPTVLIEIQRACEEEARGDFSGAGE